MGAFEVCQFRPTNHLAVLHVGLEVVNCVSVLPFSLSFPSHRASHTAFTLRQALAHTVVPTAGRLGATD